VGLQSETISTAEIHCAVSAWNQK